MAGLISSNFYQTTKGYLRSFTGVFQRNSILNDYMDFLKALLSQPQNKRQGQLPYKHLNIKTPQETLKHHNISFTISGSLRTVCNHWTRPMDWDTAWTEFNFPVVYSF